MPGVTAFRISNWDTPLWANPNRRAGRFNRLGSRTTQYWSLDPLGPWAEYLRFHDLRDVADIEDLRLRVWAAHLDLPEDTLDVSFEGAAALGIAADALVDDDWARCQLWAGSLTVSAILVPSAAMPGTRNLVMFGERVRIPYAWSPVDPAIDIPCDAIVDVGSGVSELQEHVRWRGQLHAEFEAWRTGSPFTPPFVNVAMV